MNRFDYAPARTLSEASALMTSTVADAMVAPSADALPDEAAVLKAGGMDLLDLMKEDVLRPARIVHLRDVPGLDQVRDEGPQGVVVGALVTLATIAAHPLIRERYRALADAAEHSGHPQVRNVATLGGNLAQRPKCWYFRQADYHCLRKGGGTCFAIPGEHQYHAVFDNRFCAIVHPSTAATALAALGASVDVVGREGAPSRSVPIDRFFVSSSQDVRRENVLRAGEIITGVRLPALPPGTKSAHIKQAERESFDWSVADAAVVLERSAPDGPVARASVVLGAAAPVPWRAEAAERLLVGRPLTEETAREAARAALQSATPLPKNTYKLPMFEAVVRRTIMQAARA